LDLLRHPAVLDDLGLMKDERTEVNKLTGKLDEQRNAWFGPGRPLIAPDEARKRSLQQARDNDKAVRMILSESQLRRLPEIALQQQGTGAFREPDVAAALKLKADQREEIRRIDEGVFFTLIQAMQDGRRPGGPSEDVRKANEQKTRKEGMEQILALLTPEQKKRWTGLTGEPFKGPALLFPPFFPGGRPGGPGGERKGPPPGRDGPGGEPKGPPPGGPGGPPPG
jgi:hypothetical protein